MGCSTGDFRGVNSPLAISMDVCPCSAFDVGDNHPPGKNRDDVVDSCLLRKTVGKIVSTCEEASVGSPSLTGVRRRGIGLRDSQHQNIRSNTVITLYVCQVRRAHLYLTEAVQHRGEMKMPLSQHLD